MRQRREDDRGAANRQPDVEPQWLHEHRHGNNSDRGNYTTDSHFHPGTGRAYEKDFYDQRTFNANADQGYTYPQGRYQAGGAMYSGDNYMQNQRSSQNNPYGMTYTRDDGHNSGRHYDSRADYSNTDYDSFRQRGRPSERTGMADERFGHDVRRGRGQDDDQFMGHSSPGDYESYSRYERGNNMYNNDYSGGFAGRNQTEGRAHFGEDTHFSNLDRWNQNDRSEQRRGDRR